MEQQVISQKQTTKKSTAEKKPILPHGTDFFQLLADLTLQQKRHRTALRAN